jgi:hypothetical protein
VPLRKQLIRQSPNYTTQVRGLKRAVLLRGQMSTKLSSAFVRRIFWSPTMTVIVVWGCDRVRINESDIHVIVIIHPQFAKSPAASPEDIPQDLQSIKTPDHAQR